MEERITIRTMQHQASFWVMLTGFLSNVDVENSDGRKIKITLLKTAEREMAALSKLYNERQTE